jgi:hypothetical protein
MKTIDIHEPQAISCAIAKIHHQPIIVQLPTVFVLMAAPTVEGALQLDRTKSRLSGKNYGTAIGDLKKFLQQAIPENLPSEFSKPEDYIKMTGAFIRLQFRDKNFQSSAIRNGSHQGVLLDGIFNELFTQIEDSFEGHPVDGLWGEKNYGAPLCTSCNVSGDHEGSIVAYDKAIAFGKANGISLMLTSGEKRNELGSYPIFGFEADRVTIHRQGPGLPDFQDKIPYKLRGW